MDNALRYAADGGVLDISYDATPDTVSVIFRDKGPAVPNELLEDIFTPFVREEVSRSSIPGLWPRDFLLPGRYVKHMEGNWR
ncbi:ATP-binding protein [Klebsiella pneumoniae]|uniref:ATP-binding protein n=1 Tax=Klebsiella pneumoniae TaxID=573 RepID=UPI0029E7D288|nr:ATP-binding protein [Klebsiella pneumoniae]